MKKNHIDLLYFEGCPHVEAARVSLRKALVLAGFEPQWNERVMGESGGGDEYPSPTILVGRHDVTPVPPNSGAHACRVGGAPGVMEITAAIEAGHY